MVPNITEGSVGPAAFCGVLLIIWLTSVDVLKEQLKGEMMDVQHLTMSEVSIIMVADKDHCSFKSCGVPLSKRGNLSAREGGRSHSLIWKRVNNFKSMIVVFSHQVVSHSSQPRGLQHARLPCPSLSRWVCSNSCPLCLMSSSHPSPLSPLAFHHSQHQGLFQWVSSSHQVAAVLEFQHQHQSFQWVFRVDFP